MSQFSHFNEQGRAKMVDISDKSSTVRTAVAVSSVRMIKEVFHKIQQPAKQTSTIIPMCHPLALKGVDISFHWEEDGNAHILNIQVQVKTKGSTGVEMEALTSASVCALTVYDMCKAIDKGMIIGPTYLIEKTGGKNGDFHRASDI
ncbi:cyclic pyranopterin monophosphate synthase MoaC [Bacillus safensis]|uniref:cyclic pyranopterin monophosphate synthase MoaC n=1 Tax=Bacillus safensis TaxID=561879 RepID=UPI002DBDC197|nr:cyclic pyranopterin monophosphate synthase MoaC [Bacillus safensis]MEC3628112.1 cyclic pyranopterin monophosphate synthase MoaC [Bacillus safensis]